MPNKQITIADKTFELYIEHIEIGHMIQSLARKINKKYKGEELIIIGVLNGSFMFLSDLVKELSEEIKITVSFIKVSSYHGATTTSGNVKNILGLDVDIKGKNVIIVEDILDTLTTINSVCSTLCKESPATLKVYSLLSKQPHPDAYYGKYIENDFVVGYGMDYVNQGRNYKDIYRLK